MSRKKPASLADRLRTAIERDGMTQLEAARRIGVSPQRLSGIVSPCSRPKDAPSNVWVLRAVQRMGWDITEFPEAQAALKDLGLGG